jgi:hypothetical protein
MRYKWDQKFWDSQVVQSSVGSYRIRSESSRIPMKTCRIPSDYIGIRVTIRHPDPNLGILSDSTHGQLSEYGRADSYRKPLSDADASQRSKNDRIRKLSVNNIRYYNHRNLYKTKYPLKWHPNNTPRHYTHQNWITSDQILRQNSSDLCG